MDLDELRDALDEVGRRTAVDPMEARAAVGARSQRLQRRRRSVALVSIAAVIALVVGTIALANTHGHKSVNITPVGPPPGAGDPLPAGSVMLQVTNGTIGVLDAFGKPLATLVPDGPIVTNAQLMPDHRTLWYAAQGASSCPEVVRLDLKTNEHTVIAHAKDFSLTPDGRKLVLVWPASDAFVQNHCQPVPFPCCVEIYDGAFVERDLTTGEQWVLPADDYRSAGTDGPSGHVFIDPAANVIISSNCVKGGCSTSTYSVPEHGSGPIVYSGPGPACGCETLVAGEDGVYAVNLSTLEEPAAFIRRYDAGRIEGSSTVIEASGDVELESSLALTRDGIYAIGHRPVGTPERFVYRVHDSRLQRMFPTDALQISAIPPFEAPADTSPDSSVVPTTVRTAPSTTVRLIDTDPLPAGSVVLQASGREISVLDANGNKLKTLVTAFEGRTVRNVQLMPDHTTIWYATEPDDGRSSCPEVVKLNLGTNERTVVAHADDFAITPDGRRLVLIFPRSDAVVANNCAPLSMPPGGSIFAAGFVERDLTTGEQWTLPFDGYHNAGTGGPHGHMYIDTATNKLISAHCVLDGCFTDTYSVPEHASDPIVYSGTGPACRCNTLVAGDDGVYGISGVEDSVTQPPRTSVVRYTADRIEGSGTVVATSNDVELSSSVAPTPSGVFVIGSGKLYRVNNGGLQLVGPTSAQQIFAIPPFVGG